MQPTKNLDSTHNNKYLGLISQVILSLVYRYSIVHAECSPGVFFLHFALDARKVII